MSTEAQAIEAAITALLHNTESGDWEMLHGEEDSLLYQFCTAISVGTIWGVDVVRLAKLFCTLDEERPYGRWYA